MHVISCVETAITNDYSITWYM